jgi:hypothetical protein
MQVVQRSLLQISIICSLNSLSFASDRVFMPTAREAGMSNASAALPDIFSASNNPAVMANLNQASIGLQYQNLFQIEELNSSSAWGTVPVPFGAFGAAASYFGTARFNEQRYTFGYARKLGTKISAGVLFNYLTSNLPDEYSTARALAGEVGLLLNPIEKLNIGLHIFNVSGAEFLNYNYEELPVFFRAGASWTDDIFLLSSQIQMSNSGETILSLGSEITLVKNLFLRAGISSSGQTRYSFGLGYKISRIAFDVAFNHHPVLGFSSFVSLQYNFIGNAR